MFPWWSGGAALLSLAAVLGLCAPAQAEVTRSGTLQAIVADDFRTGDSTTRYSLVAGGEQTPVRPTALEAEPGDRVRVRGEMRAGKLTGEVEALSESPPPAALAAPRKTAVVLFRFPGDAAQPWSPDATRSRVFTASNSANAFYEEESHGEISLAGKLNPNGDVFGWLTVNAAATGCPYQQWSDAADEAADDAGIDLTGYDHVMYFFPARTGCGFAGIATVNGSWSMINGNQGVHPIAHELGHNLGLQHASSWTCTAGGVRVPLSNVCSVSDYGDPFDVMGNIAPRHNNGWYLEQLGTLAPQNVETVDASGTYHLRASLNATTEVTTLLVPATGFAGSLNSWFQLEVRQTGGVFENVADASMTGVSIRAAQIGVPQTLLLDMNPGTASFMDAPLKAGQTFDAGAVSIKTVSAGGGNATVFVELDEEPPTAPTGLTATAGTSGVQLQWDASSDNVGVEHYLVFRDGEQIGAAGPTSFTDSVVTPGEHTYVVYAEDETRNRSAGSEPATVTLDAVEGPGCAVGECTMAYLYSGAPATWNVPLGVEEARFVVEGAQGGDSRAGILDGGARVTATIESLSTGEEVTVTVGGKGESHADGGEGGFGGGGDGTRGGGGGGASSVEIDSTLMLLAGGGGGAGLAGVDALGGDDPGGGRGGQGSEIGGNGIAGAALSAHGATLGGGRGGVRGGNEEAGGESGGGGGGKGGVVTGTSSCGGGGAPGAPGAAGGALSGGGGAPNAGGGGGGGYIGGGQGGGGATDACGNIAGAGGGGGGSSYADESLSWGAGGAIRRGYGRVLIAYPNPVVATDRSYLTMPGQELVVPAEQGVRVGSSGPDGAPLTLSLVDPPADGDLALEDDGSFTYEPDPGFTGVDSFTYRLDHPSGHYVTAEVTLRVPANPSALISSPSAGGAYELGQSVSTTFKCDEGAGGTGLDSCDDSRGKETVSGGKGSLDTSTLGAHTYTVTATSKTGLTASASLEYTVVAKKPTPPDDPDDPQDPDGPPTTPDTSPKTPDPPPPVVDTTAPKTRIAAGPARTTKQRRAQFQLRASESGSTFACKLDRGPFKPCAPGVTYKVAPGWHILKVRATDAAGNADPTPATFRWKVERTNTNR